MLAMGGHLGGVRLRRLRRGLPEARRRPHAGRVDESRPLIPGPLRLPHHHPHTPARRFALRVKPAERSTVIDRPAHESTIHQKASSSFPSGQCKAVASRVASKLIRTDTTSKTLSQHNTKWLNTTTTKRMPYLCQNAMMIMMRMIIIAFAAVLNPGHRPARLRTPQDGPRGS